MQYVENIADLEEIYGAPGQASVVKVVPQMTPLYRQWIAQSKLCILSTVGSDGTDASPRGDDGPTFREIDVHTLAMPDWRGNNRMDSLRNIVADGRVSLMFFVNGSNNVVRINGTAKVTTDAELCASFEQNGRQPRSVTLIKIKEVYSQCARALLRSKIWDGSDRSDLLPTIGDLLMEAMNGDFDGAAYDAEWDARARSTMW